MNRVNQMIIRLREKWADISADPIRLKAFIASSVVHVTMFGALAYMGGRQIIETIDIDVEDYIEAVNTTDKSGDPNVPKQQKGKQASNKVVAAPKQVTKAETVQEKQGMPKNRVAQSQAKKKSKKIKAPVKQVQKPEDKEMKRLEVLAKKLEQREKDYQEKLVQVKKEQQRQQKIAKRKAELAEKARRLKIKMAKAKMAAEEEAKFKQIERNLKQKEAAIAAEQQEAMKRAKQQEAALARRQALVEKARQLKQQKAEIAAAESRAKQLAVQNALLKAREKEIEAEAKKQAELAAIQGRLEAKARQVELAEKAAQERASRQAAIDAKRRALQEREAALRMREQNLNSGPRNAYGVSLPAGARSVADLKQRPGNEAPFYPREAREQGWEGRGLYLYFVDKDGSVKTVKTVQSTGHNILDNAAEDTFTNYQFYPGQSGWTYHAVNFKLSDKELQQSRSRSSRRR